MSLTLIRVVGVVVMLGFVAALPGYPCREATGRPRLYVIFLAAAVWQGV